MTRTALTLLLLALTTVGALAETAREILDRRKALEDTTRRWNDRHQRMKFNIVDKRGGERVRELELFERKEMEKDKEKEGESKTIVFFLTPAEVKGTGFLAFDHKGKPADQWLYLPELKRVRQITARTRNESFVGTDLSYHDLDLLQEMVSWSEADARSSLRGEEAVDGVPNHTIELTPQREDIGYKRIVLWLGKEDLVPRRLEFYEDGDQPKKRINQADVRAVGAIPVAHRIEVETPANGTRTRIEVTEAQFNQKLEEDLFTQRALERGGR
jgi:outer membrane lipoprotein-sorting protein